jgi:hypothetical protein
MAGDEVGDRVVRERGADGADRGRATYLPRDPPIWPHLATRDLTRLAQHGLLEGGETAQVEPHAPLAVELVLDLAGQVSRRLGRHHGPTDVLAEPRLELLGRVRPRRRRHSKPIPGHIHGAQDRFEGGIGIGHPHLREDPIGKAGRRFHRAEFFQVSRQRDHGRLL